MGMGLAIVRSIIASHGGELAAANAPGGGACVHFSVPVIGEDQGDEENRGSRREGKRHERAGTARVFVADDDQ